MITMFGASNFPQAIDPAFISRLDLTIEIELPDPETTHAILKDVLGEVGSDLTDEEVRTASDALAGSSGRDIRKAVFEALVSRDPSVPTEAPLRNQDLWDAIESRKSVAPSGGSA